MKSIKNIFLGVGYIAVCIIFVLLSAITKVCDLTGKCFLLVIDVINNHQVVFWIVVGVSTTAIIYYFMFSLANIWSF